MPGRDGGRLTVAAFGGVTPEKRIPSLLRAVATLRDRLPGLRVVLVGEAADHYDVRADALRFGVADRVEVTGYVPDEALARYLAAADICCCLRWPTNRETSASWLRCLAAGKPTLITALAQYVTLPEVAIQIDVLDEDRELPAAIERLASDAAYRTSLGAAARQHWEARHRLEQMADDYARAIARAVTLDPPRPALPLHMRDDGSSVLRTIAAEVGASDYLADILD